MKSENGIKYLGKVVNTRYVLYKCSELNLTAPHVKNKVVFLSPIGEGVYKINYLKN